MRVAVILSAVDGGKRRQGAVWFPLAGGSSAGAVTVQGVTISADPAPGAGVGRYRVLLVEGDSCHERLIEAPDALAAALRAEDPDDRKVTHLMVAPERP
jgi:hypothetical protein